MWTGALREDQRLNALTEVVRSALAGADFVDNAGSLTAEIAGLDNPSAREQLLRVSAEELCLASPQAASAWAETLPETERDGVRWEVVKNTSHQDVPAAAERARHFLQAGAATEAAATAIAVVARNYAAANAAGAADWCLQLPPGAGQEAALQAALGSWVEMDSAAASEWIAGQPEGMARQAGARLLAAGIAETDPERALA